MSLFDLFDDDPDAPPSRLTPTAEISECGKYRYVLGRVWSMESPLVFVMLNPSKADADQDDPTIRKCIGFAKREGAGGIVVVNLYAWRSTDPAGMKAAADPVGPDNDKWIASVANAPHRGKFVMAWGAHAKDEARVSRVVELVRAAGRTPLCLGRTNGGQPRHPLMLAYATPLEEFK